MRRTWNTSVSPTIGMVIAATGNIGFGPACAAAGRLCAAPASASAPVARMVRRSTVSIGVLLRLILLLRAYLDRQPALDNPALGLGAGTSKKAREMLAFRGRF